jgi:nucleotide-binding universal stress UspA family protein
LPTDGTPPTEDSTRYAVQLAKHRGAEVLALYAVDDSMYGTYHWAGIREKVLEELEKEGKEAIEKVKEAAGAEGVKVRGVIEHGPIHEVIARATRKNPDVVMLVMAGSGKDWAGRVFLGSVTAMMIRGTKKWVVVPVCITPFERLNPKVRFDLAGGKILLPTDGSRPAEEAARYAMKVAKCLGSKVIGLYVVDEREFGLFSRKKDLVLGELEREGKEALERVQRLGKEEGVEVEKEMETGIIQETIARYTMEDPEIRMVIIGASGKDFKSRLFVGSVTENLTKNISRTVLCPIIVTPSTAVNPEARLIF